MSRRVPVIDDPELIELFAEDPEGLAIVDAIAATQPRHQRFSMTGRNRVLALVAAVVVVAVVLAALTRSQSHAGVIAKALAQVPTTGVIHVVLRDQGAAFEVTELGSGETASVHHTITEWVAPATGVRRIVDSIDGSLVSDERLTASSPADAVEGLSIQGLDRLPALYRRALESATDNDLARGTYRGQPVYWLNSKAGGAIAAVALSERTFRPVAIRFRAENGGTRSFTVTSFDRLSKSRVPPSIAVTRLSAEPIASQRAVALADLPIFAWSADTLAPPLRAVSVRQLSLRDGATVADVLLADHVERGKLPQRFVRLEVARRPEKAFGWTTAIADLVHGDHVVVRRTGMYRQLYVAAHSRFIRITTSLSRDKLLHVARELRSD
jgi:hypothetical protein